MRAGPLAPRRLSVLGVCGALVAGACGPGAGPVEGGGGPAGRLVVFAASSLTEPFERLGREFESAHPGAKVRFNFAGSSALARQITEGSGADVFAAADEHTMARVTGAGRARHPVVMARNRLTVLVERGNPRGIRSLADLARPGLVVVVCAPEVPCGRLAAEAFAAAGVALRASSLEENVKAVVARVALGEADAGIVYRSDVRGAGARVEAVDAAGLDADDAPQAVYPIAVATTSANPVAARAFVALVVSARGRAALAASGFLVP